MRKAAKAFYICWKNEKSFCNAKVFYIFSTVQKLFSFLQQKYWHILDIIIWSFNGTLNNDVVSFEQPGPDVQV